MKQFSKRIAVTLIWVCFVFLSFILISYPIPQ